MWVCLGGALGSGARYLLSGWALNAFGTAFPWGTLAVNVIGSFLLAALMYVGVESNAMSATLRVALTTGVLGGFTTYSSFSYETMKCFQDGAWALGAANVLVTVCACLAACFAGWASAKWLVGV